MATTQKAANTFSLAKLKTALSKGGARSNLFEFTITKSPIDVGKVKKFADLAYLCSVSAIPGVEITPIERAHYGRMIKFPGDMVFADFTTTIYQTEGGLEHTNILTWMDNINAPNANIMKTETTSGMNHTGTGKLFERTKGGGTALTTTFMDMFPTSVSEIALSYDTTSDFEQFDVTWAYQYFTHDPTDGTLLT